MNANVQRAFSALAAVAVVAAAVFGIVGLTMTKASADTCSWTSAPTTGNVGDTLEFKVRVYEPLTDFAHRIWRWEIVLPNGERQLLTTHNSNGPSVEGRGLMWRDSSTSYTFASAGRYTVEGPQSCGSIAVIITEAPRINLSGPDSGGVGETVTYTALVTQSGRALGGYAVTFTFYAVENLAALNHQTVPTDANGRASASYAFTEPGAYRVHAAGGVSTNDERAVTITAADGGNGGGTNGDGTNGDGTNGDGGSNSNAGTGSNGDATLPNTTNASAAGLDDIASQAQAAIGLGSNALLIVLAIAGIILLAIVAAALLIRRGRREDYDYEYEDEEPYERERR